MLRTLKALYNDEAGFIVSAELVLVLTIGVLAMVVGLHAVAKSITMELNDVANAFGSINQSYVYLGLDKPGHAWVVGSGYSDSLDACDCTIIEQPFPPVKTDGSSNISESGY